MMIQARWVGCALALAAANLALGQTPRELFRDDFDRNGWENGMTNAFLPAWSAPGQGWTPPYSIDGTGYEAEVAVAGTQFQVRINGQTYLTLTDADLAPGSVGVMSWAQRLYNSTYPACGVRCDNLSVTDGGGTVTLQENWVLPYSWKPVHPLRLDRSGQSLPLGDGNIRWDFTNGCFFDDTNWFMDGTSTVHPQMDFVGPTYAYSGSGSQDWTDYRLRARILSGDDDGVGFIVRYQEDSARASFYRVTFVNQAVGSTTPPTPTRPGQGVTLQKYVLDKTTTPVTVQWSELLRDNSFIYTLNQPFDVTVTCQNVGGSTAQIKIDVIKNPDGTPTPYTFTANDATGPLLAGSVGVHVWGNTPTRFQTFGGTSATTPLLVALDDTVLVGNVFAKTYNSWKSTYTGGQVAGNAPDWGILLANGDLAESSDGRQGDGATGSDGKYKPYIMVKDGFNSGADYTLRATLKTHDDDGHGLVFGYTDNNNYFRVGFRAQASNLGFPQGISIQKVVGGTITQLGVVSNRPPRNNMAGIWIQKLGNMAIEMSDNIAMYDNSSGYGIGFQGPRLVRGNTSWTDYTFESVIETKDNDGIGLLFRFQDERNFYRLTFEDENQGAAGAPPPGISLQKVKNGVYTELFRDVDPSSPGDNDVNPGVGFKYVSPDTWTARVIATGGTFRIQIDYNGTPNYYQATVVDSDPLANGKVGLHTWGHDANEFRNIRLTLAGQSTPEFEDGTGTPDPLGWYDATVNTMSDPASVVGEEIDGGPCGAGALISGIGLRPDLKALGVRDARWISGTYIDPANHNRGCINFDGPRAVGGDAYWADYSYTVDLKAMDDDGIGILFRYQDEDNFYRLMFLSQDNNGYGGPPRGVSVQKRYHGVYSELLYSPEFIYTPGEKWTVQVDGHGADFTISITQASDYDHDGKTQYTMTFSDPSDPFAGGKIGVTCWGEKAAANEVNTLLQTGGLDWTQNFHEGAVWDNIVVVGTTGRSVPDFNGDHMVNNADFILFESCWTGPHVQMVDPSDICRHADQDGDLDVDQDDFAILQRCYSGTGLLDADCIR